MTTLLEIETPQLGIAVSYKILHPTDVEAFLTSHTALTKEEYTEAVLREVIFNLKTDVAAALRKLSKDDAQSALSMLFNSCIMLNPGLDIQTWLSLASLGEQITKMPTATSFAAAAERPCSMISVVKKLTRSKFMGLETYLKSKVIGQDEAIDELINTFKRAQAGLNDVDRPLGVFLLAGSSGIGKSHVAKCLQKYLYNDIPLVRVDCGEYQLKHDVHKLLGAPPSFVGYDEGGQLATSMLANPNTVVLLDEAEKAHPDLWNAFLRVFDEGYLTDNHGQEIDFRGAIVVMTTNLGNQQIVSEYQARGVGFAHKQLQMPSRDRVVQLANEGIQKSFKPELLNRIDSIIVFNHLQHDDFEKIAILELHQLQEKLNSRGLILAYGQDVIEGMVSTGVDPIKGVRGLAKVRRDQIENLLADTLIVKRLNRGTILNLLWNRDKGFYLQIQRARKVSGASG